jgi:ribosomal protein S9
MLTQVVFLSKAEVKRQRGTDAMDEDDVDDEDEDSDLLAGIANSNENDDEADVRRTGRVHLRTGDFNARKKDMGHIKDIAEGLLRDDNRSREYPLFIAISQSEVENVKDFITAKQAQLEEHVPIARWAKGVDSVMVLAGQHRIGSARYVVNKLSKELTTLQARLPGARNEQKARLAEADEVLRDERASNEKKSRKKDVSDAATEEVRQLEIREGVLRRMIDQNRFWPAIFYDKGEWNR